MLNQKRRAFLKLYVTPGKAHVAYGTRPNATQHNRNLSPDSSTQRTSRELRTARLPRGPRAAATAAAPPATLATPVAAAAASATLSLEGVGRALGSRLQSPLVAFDETACLVAEG